VFPITSVEAGSVCVHVLRGDKSYEARHANLVHQRKATKIDLAVLRSSCELLIYWTDTEQTNRKIQNTK